MAIQNIFVVGAGLMGSGIAQNAITCGFDVTLNDKQQAAVERAQMNIQKSLEREVSKGRMTQEAMDEALTHLTVDSSMEAPSRPIWSSRPFTRTWRPSRPCSPSWKSCAP